MSRVSVQGILLDTSVLFSPDGDDNAPLQSGADYLLRKLHHSKIPTGICYGTGLSTSKISRLERMSDMYSFKLFTVNPSSISNTITEVERSWGGNGRIFLYVVSNQNKELGVKFWDHGWTIIILDTECGQSTESSRMVSIDKLEKVPSVVSNLNKKTAEKDNVVVGYFMKPSREEDFAKRGAFPLNPTENGLIFMPLTFELPISSQLQQVDVVLHKATDEINSVEMSSSSELSSKIVYSSGMQELQRCTDQLPDCCVIDPFNSIYPVVDRFKIQQILLTLESINKEGRPRIRGPHFLKVDNFKEPNLVERLSEAKLSPPCIVKPQVACGVSDAHSMAIVFRPDDYVDLSVPLPAIVQEYVDHTSRLFKFYVLGDKVFHAVKKSTPNSSILSKQCESNGLKPLLFDSLKSLPTTAENREDNNKTMNMDVDVVNEAAAWLKKTLDLTIFGFDVVVEEGSGDHVIVDVNYLPSFKEVADDIAIPAFWDAILTKYVHHKNNS